MPRFTIANCREMAARSVAARKAAEAERKAMFAPLLAPAGPPTNQSLGRDNVRAREYDMLLQKLKDQLAKEREPTKLDRLASAIARLEEVYQVYADIPKPGRKKPPPEASRRREMPRMMPSLPTQPQTATAG
jgi:hypothetical protein